MLQYLKKEKGGVLKSRWCDAARHLTLKMINYQATKNTNKI
jgi:hypothetical protein